MSVRECIDGPQGVGSRTGYHDWQLLDPDEPPPRTSVCTRCGKHVPPWPSDPDYEEFHDPNLATWWKWQKEHS